ncbi:DUF1127 domain-containing protein [Fodinicurvata sp. EGI_FJ10296]|uniref:DUF1127 domain-containing protein n=1 Tax=Fodinicurvata sp. EGI_FJ10296 TaxID=3231908 RepID=UPI0034568F0E
MYRDDFSAIETDRIDAVLRRANNMRAEYVRSFFARAARVVGAGWTAMLGRVRTNRILTELQSLSDRELADIGLSRGDIPYLSRQIGSGEPVDVAAALSTSKPTVPAVAPANSDIPAPADSVSGHKRAA